MAGDGAIFWMTSGLMGGGAGMPGEKGDKGDKGDSPVKGVDYFDGANGTTPVKGVDYFDGQDSVIPGPPGYTPIKGVDYDDGIDGYTPIKGVDYFDGENGADSIVPGPAGAASVVPGPKGDTGDPGTTGAAGKMAIQYTTTLTLTNSPATVREVLNSATYRIKVDLTGYTQYRWTMWVATAGAVNGDVSLQGSTDGTNFGGLDAGNTELTLNPVGSKDTGWLTIAEAYRADNVFIRMREKDGDGVLDPVIRQVMFYFR